MTDMPKEIWISDAEGSHARVWCCEVHGSTKYHRDDYVKQLEDALRNIIDEPCHLSNAHLIAKQALRASG